MSLLVSSASAIRRSLHPSSLAKHAIKQVDGLPSNAGIDVWDSFAPWVPQQINAYHAIRQRSSILLEADTVHLARLREGLNGAGKGLDGAISFLDVAG